MSVRLSARLTGFAAISVTATPSTHVAAGTLTATRVPTISGPARVGNTLRASAGTWSVPVTARYQWLRDGAVIAGATSATYALRPADRKARLAVRVTAAASGFTTATSTSVPTTRTKIGSIRIVRKPKVKGKARVGRTVRVTAGKFATPGSKVKVRYQWLRNGKAIKGAKSAKYRVKKADRKARLRVRVTVNAPGYKKVRVAAKLSGRVKPKS